MELSVFLIYITTSTLSIKDEKRNNFFHLSHSHLYIPPSVLSYWCLICFICWIHYHYSPSSFLPPHVKTFTSLLFFHSSIPSSPSLLSSLLLSCLFYLSILPSVSSPSFLLLLHIITVPSLLFFHSCVFLISPTLLSQPFHLSIISSSYLSPHSSNISHPPPPA
jgi:hypothetical protein